MLSLSPYLNFKGDAEEAFGFYRSVFGGEFLGVMRFRDFGEDAMGVPESDRDKIAHIALPMTEGVNLMASDVAGPAAADFTVGNNVYLYIEAESAEEADRLFGALSQGGSEQMPMQSTEWAEKYGICIDRFGIGWMIGYTGDVKFEM